MSSGWASIHRSLLDSDLWLSEKFSRGQAWVDLILLANHKDGFFRCRGVQVKVLRGQCGHGAVALSNRWKWSRGKVIRFLKELENDSRIVQQKDNVTTLISILKYEEYQSQQNSKRAASRTANGQQTDINNNDNNDNNDNNIKNKPSPKPANGVPYQKIVTLYHEMLPTLPKVEKLTEKRKSQIRQRWLQDDLPDLNNWENFFDYVSKSKFLMGASTPVNGHRVFTANLEWLTKESNFIKICEKNYHG